MSRARDLADLGGSADAGGLTGRNLIINGAMTVAQRGTSQQITDSSGGYFTCDRWRYSQFNGYAADIDATMSQETDTPNNTFKNSFKFLVGTGTAAAAGDAISIEQIIEGQDIVQLAQGTSDAKKFTVSFWVKASIAGTYCISLHSGKSFGSNRSHVKEYTISSANTWEYKTVTVDGDTSGTWAEDNGAGLSLAFTLGAGSTYQGAANTWSDSDYFATSNQTQLTETTNATWFVTGVQLEVGETATPFEHRSFGDELRRCLRYYEQWGGDDAYEPFGFLEAANADLGYAIIEFSEKRDGPTVTVSDAGHFQTARSAIVFTSMSFSQPSTTHVFNTITKVGAFTGGQIYSWRANNTTSARIYFNAEL